MNDDLITVPEIMEALGLSQARVWKALDDGTIPCVVKYGKRLASKSDVEAYKMRTQPDGTPRVGRPKKTSTS